MNLQQLLQASTELTRSRSCDGMGCPVNTYVLAGALARAPGATSPLAVLAEFGGFEIAMSKNLTVKSLFVRADLGRAGLPKRVF